jgi:hypothetical protein
VAKDVLVRGVDEKIYSSLGNAAKERGISINSLVKDAIDSWLAKKDDQTQIHHLVIYSDDKALANLLKSLDYFAQKSGWFKCYCGPKTNPSVKLLEEMKWHNGTIATYDPNLKNLSSYCGKIIQKIAKESNRQPVCCIDFIVGDIANKKSLSEAIKMEHEYNEERLGGLMFCPYKTHDLLSTGIDDMIELFEEHDQIFILKDDKVYKIHLTLESTHKMIMN